MFVSSTRTTKIKSCLMWKCAFSCFFSHVKCHVWFSTMLSDVKKQKKIMRKSTRLMWFLFFSCYYCRSGAARVPFFIGFYSPRHENVWNSNEKFITKKNHILQQLNFITQHLSIQHLKMWSILFMKTFPTLSARDVSLKSAVILFHAIIHFLRLAVTTCHEECRTKLSNFIVIFNLLGAEL